MVTPEATLGPVAELVIQHYREVIETQSALIRALASELERAKKPVVNVGRYCTELHDHSQYKCLGAPAAFTTTALKDIEAFWKGDGDRPDAK